MKKYIIVLYWFVPIPKELWLGYLCNGGSSKQAAMRRVPAMFQAMGESSTF